MDTLLLQPWPLIGRDGELEAFRTTLADPGQRVFLIRGQAGVGKSRLAEECSVIAAAQGHPCIRAVTSLSTRTVAFAATQHLLPTGIPRDNASLFRRLMTKLHYRHTRTVMLIDDLQYLDAASATLLVQLLDANRLFLLATVHADQPAPGVITAIDRVDQCRRTDLAPFDAGLAQLVLEEVLGGPVGQATVLRLCELSGGVPGIIRELVTGALASATLRGDGGIWRLTGPMPPTDRLVDIVEQRLQGLDEQDRRVIETIALCTTCGARNPDQHSLARLERAGLIRIGTRREHMVAELAVPIYGDVIRARLAPQDRREQLAEHTRRLQATGPQRREDVLQPVTCVVHGDAGDPKALDEAVEHARSSRDFSLVAGIARAVSGQEHSAAARLTLAEAHFELGRYDLARATLLETENTAPTEQDGLRAALLHGRLDAWVTFDPHKARHAQPAPNQPPPLPVVQAACDAALANIHLVRGETSAALKLVSNLDRVPDSAVGVLGALPASWALAERAHARKALGIVDQALHTYRQGPVHPAPEHPAMYAIPQILALALAGDIREAIRVGEAHHADAARDNAPTALMWTALYLGVVEHWAGHLPRAIVWFASAAALAEDYNAQNCRWRALNALALVHAARGDSIASDEAWRKAQSLALHSHRHADVLAAPGWRQAASGRLPAARELLAQASAQARAAGSLAAEARLLSDIARLGDPRRAAGRLNTLSQICDSVLVTTFAQHAEALAGRDPRRLEQVAARLEEFGADLLAAESFAHAAMLHRAAGDHMSAARASDRARPLADRCGHDHIVPTAATNADEPLTAREREIARLVTQGMTSREIAGQLVISIRTVDSHLQHIYRKTGVFRRKDLHHVLRHASV
jgi:DNA-binding CsgD family transcriptional regulator